MSRRHHGDENKQGGDSLNSTEASPKSSTESEPKTRIAKPCNKTVLKRSTQPPGTKAPAAREDPTQETGESTSAMQRLHMKTTG